MRFARSSLLASVLAVGIVVAPSAGRAQASTPTASRVLLIGAADGDEPYLFSRISGAVRLSSGVIVVANQSSGELRWFSPTGNWLRSRGRLGDGPGEFRGLRRVLRLPGDSILAEDGLSSRMTLYDSGGTLVRSWSIAEAAASLAPPPLGRLPDGSFVALAERALARPPGYTRFEASLLRYRDGRILDTLLVSAGGEWYTVGCGTQASPALCGVGVPYGLRSLAASSGPFVYFGTGERYEVLRLDVRSRKLDTLRRDVPATPLSAARRAAFIDSIAGTVPESRRALVRQRFSEAPVRRAMPFFEALATDDRGNLWLARPQERSASERAWDVLAADGRFVRTVMLPSSLSVTALSDGYVVGVARDADGVESVAVYRLR
jgi:hypothetical protein